MQISQKDLFNNPNYPDIIISDNGTGKQYYAHKAVLSNGSHYFSQLFNQDSTITRLEIDEDGSECLEIMLRYLYTGTWEPVKPETLDDFDEYMEKIVAGS